MRKLTQILTILCYVIFNNLTAQEKPNIVFILTDDQSYGMMGCTGNNIVQTPNLDKLAKDGVLFTNAHVTSAICTPSRISILLSQYERKHAVNFNSGTSVNNQAWSKSYPMVMRDAGYYTGWIGKNHAPIGDNGYKSGVMEKSFDYWYAGHGHIRFYPKQIHDIFNDAIAHTQVEIINEAADDFLDPNARKLKGAVKFLEVRPKDKPFLLSINFNLPHGAGTETMKLKKEDDDIYKTLYRDIKIPLPPNYIAKKDIKTPKLPADVLRTEDRQTGYNYVDTPAGVKERYTRQLQAMTGIDRMVGNLRAKLKELKIDKNTVIIFTSDHGLFMGEQGLGAKALCYEKTTHVPLIIYNPKLKRKYRAQKNDALVQTIDVAPTILAFGNVKQPKEFQGKSILPLLTNKNKTVRDYVFTENLWSTHFGNPKCEALQNKEWKYIRYYKNTTRSASKEIETARMIGMPINKMLYAVHDPDIAYYRYLSDSSLEGEQPVYEELYHLKNDPLELNNLANSKKHQTILTNLRTVWKKELINARGTEKPQVLRYTTQSRNQKKTIKNSKH